MITLAYTTLNSAFVMADEPVKPASIYPTEITLDVMRLGPRCNVTIPTYGIFPGCQLPSGNIPDRFNFTYSGHNYLSICSLDKQGFREFCIVGSNGVPIGVPDYDVLLANGAGDVGERSGWGFIRYSQYPYEIAKLEYGPGFAWIELYNQTDLKGEKICTMLLNLETTQQTCNGLGRQARSAKIFGFYYDDTDYSGKRYKLCLRTPQDEANRCFYHTSANTKGEFSVMNIDNKDSPGSWIGVEAKGDKISGSLYSIDYLYTR
jgi:hypothetical protein